MYLIHVTAESPNTFQQSLNSAVRSLGEHDEIESVSHAVAPIGAPHEGATVFSAVLRVKQGAVPVSF